MIGTPELPRLRYIPANGLPRYPVGETAFHHGSRPTASIRTPLLILGARPGFLDSPINFLAADSTNNHHREGKDQIRTNENANVPLPAVESICFMNCRTA